MLLATSTAHYKRKSMAYRNASIPRHTQQPISLSSRRYGRMHTRSPASDTPQASTARDPSWCTYAENTLSRTGRMASNAGGCPDTSDERRGRYMKTLTTSLKAPRVSSVLILKQNSGPRSAIRRCTALPHPRGPRPCQHTESRSCRSATKHRWCSGACISAQPGAAPFRSTATDCSHAPTGRSLHT